jgi:hypothetical protein
MGRVGSALDNAAAEAFDSTIKVEDIHRHRFHTRAEARLKIATWIVDFYNTDAATSRSSTVVTSSRWPRKGVSVEMRRQGVIACLGYVAGDVHPHTRSLK